MNKLEHKSELSLILKGLEIAFKRMLGFKKRNNSEIAIMKDGKLCV